MPPADPPTDVRDLRAAPRYIVRTSLPGTFGAVEVEILDLSDCGIQVRHSEGIRLSTPGRLSFRANSDSKPVALRGTVVWSHISKTPDNSGHHPFYSGVRLDVGDTETARQAIEELIRTGHAVPDSESLEAKRRRMAARQASRRQAGAARPVYQSTISPDQVLMIHHARERLRQFPDEARKWYMRAKFAMAEDESRAREAPMHYREDVLAVWEYLERSVEVGTIVKVFEKQLR